MDDRQTFAALCAQPRLILRDNVLCCNDVFELIRARVCPPRVWAIDLLRDNTAFYDMGMHAWSEVASVNDLQPISEAPVDGRGWLIIAHQSRQTYCVREWLLFLEPGNTSPAVVPYKAVLSHSILTHVNHCVVGMQHDLQCCRVQVTRADLDNLARGTGDYSSFQLENSNHTRPISVFPCGGGALLGLRIHSTPLFRHLDLDSQQLIPTTGNCPIERWESAIQAMPVSVGVEFWDARGPVALYDFRAPVWQSYASGAPVDGSCNIQSVVSIDSDLVACSRRHASVDGSFLRFYDRKAMAFVPHTNPSLRNTDARSMICL